MRLLIVAFALISALLLLSPSLLYAQEEDYGPVSREYLEKAKVLAASPTETLLIEGSGIERKSQTLTIEVLEGRDKGKVVTFQNDFTQLEEGEVFYVRHTAGGEDPEMWSVSDPYRLDWLIGVAVAFLVILLLFGGIQGVRGLASLIGSLFLIFYLLLPGIYSGLSPILVSIGVSSLIIIAGSYITHGFNRTTTTAMLGMLATVVVTGLATYVVLHGADLSGFTSEDNVYLNFNTDGRINMISLLFGGIMIGLLGVLYDVAIGQAIAVEELLAAAAHYSKKQVFTRAMRIGREHIGALVNTLAIAYVGASLPLLLLLKEGVASTSVGYILNSETFATEIIRILMGSMGIVLAVPITSLLATYALYGRPSRATESLHRH